MTTRHPGSANPGNPHDERRRSLGKPGQAARRWMLSRTPANRDGLRFPAGLNRLIELVAEGRLYGMRPADAKRRPLAESGQRPGGER